ncbi:MAG: DUF1361 domain-containing protein [Chloroflexi bacterium]|nr:DUF1361 domain-containing protein [Chloroflexota bacterium]
MSAGLNNIVKVHRFFLSQLLYPLVLSSLLAVGIFAGRVYLSQRMTLWFLLWNLFLAWVPYLCSLAAILLHRRQPKAWWLILLPGFVWLIFLPNAPYLVTDILHLDERAPVPVWYDIAMLATFAWTGVFLGMASLSQMQSIVRRFLGGAASWLFALSTIALSGLGIYLGRFLNLNSWDLFTRPQIVLVGLGVRIANPLHYQQALGFTLLFAAFMLVCYVTFVSIEHRKLEVRN